MAADLFAGSGQMVRLTMLQYSMFFSFRSHHLLFGLLLLTLKHSALAATQAPKSPQPDPVEQLIVAGDKSWLSGAPDQSEHSYEQALAVLTPRMEPFRSLVILRLSRARLAAGNKAGALKALELLKKLPYLPEHHALEARELESMIRTGKSSGAVAESKPSHPPASVTIAVSPSGPSFAEALARARSAKAGGKSVEIVLAPGMYPIREGFSFTQEDSGLTVRSQDPRSPAVLTGGVPLPSWKPVSDPMAAARIPAAARAQVRVCDLKACGIKDLELVFGGFGSRRANPKSHPARYATMPVPELIYRDKVQPMARWPKNGLARLFLDKTPPADLARYQAWAKEPDLWFYGYWKNTWADAYEKVTSIDPAGKVTLAEPTNRFGFGRNMGCALNALSDITSPGEWCLDTTKGLLYYYPPKDFDPRACVLSVHGTPVTATNCHGLQIRDLKFRDVRGDALVLTDCTDLEVSGLGIRNCSGLGMSIHGGTHHLVRGCSIESMGRGGIDLIAGDWARLLPSGSVIENCRFARLARIDHTYAPAVLAEGMGIVIRRNLFEELPSSAIRLAGNDMLVELNIFRQCVQESDDQGAVDVWQNPLYRGNVIRRNFFDRIIGARTSRLGAAAIRHDDYISGFMVSENIFCKGSNGGFGAMQYNKGVDNYAEGNVVIDWHKAVTGTSLPPAKWPETLKAKTPIDKVPWQSEAWIRKYPRLRDLLGKEEKHNYFADNILLGASTFGSLPNGVYLNNNPSDSKFRFTTLADLKKALPPWRSIPLDQIGPAGVE